MTSKKTIALFGAGTGSEAQGIALRSSRGVPRR